MLLLLARRTAEERIASFLLSISLRFSQRGFSGIVFRLSMSRHEIANYLGLAAETVSRIFRRFKEYGIALSNGRMITIQNYAVLEDWANIK
jgi:CRP/FNR family transcriptional regulator